MNIVFNCTSILDINCSLSETFKIHPMICSTKAAKFPVCHIWIKSVKCELKQLHGCRKGPRRLLPVSCSVTNLLSIWHHLKSMWWVAWRNIYIKSEFKTGPSGMASPWMEMSPQWGVWGGGYSTDKQKHEQASPVTKLDMSHCDACHWGHWQEAT